MYYKTIVCLANSRKPPRPSSCVAGKEIGSPTGQGWIRPVSARPGREISLNERMLTNGQEVQLLDVVRIEFDSHLPEHHQLENHLIRPTSWVKMGRASWEQVLSFGDAFDADFWIAADSTQDGLSDKLAESLAVSRKSSLKLIVVPKLTVRVFDQPGFRGAPSRKRVQGQFTYHGKPYWLWVTDPVAEDYYKDQPNGEYSLGEVALCISLAEPQNQSASRLIASIITPGRCESHR